MNKNTVCLIKESRCYFCGKESRGRIYPGWMPTIDTIALPPHCDGHEQEFIDSVIIDHGDKPWLHNDRVAHYEFIKEHWNCQDNSSKLISFEAYNDYLDNFSRHGIWIFQYSQKEKERIRREVLPKLS